MVVEIPHGNYMAETTQYVQRLRATLIPTVIEFINIAIINARYFRDGKIMIIHK